MGVRFGTLTTNTFANALPANAIETVVFQLATMIQAVDAAVVIFQWGVQVLTGTGNTVLVARIRAGTTITDRLVGASTWSQKVTAGNYWSMAGWYFDQPGAVDTAYCFTLQQNGATGAGTLQNGSFAAFIL